MATLAEITKGKTPAQLNILKRELTTRLQSMTPDRRAMALREISGIPELNSMFGQPATSTQPTQKETTTGFNPPSWLGAGLNKAMNVATKMPWIQIHGMIAEARHRGNV
jgi:hypothetical protein